MARSSASPAAPAHYVVDGSNIATEGRAMPSLQQLNDAVMAFIEEHPNALITVVVDATFGHRIDKREVDAFDQAVANNELVTPPAGAVGRGDAFVLTIAHKAKAGILSNDSFQEFHGEYPWLFDPGRLVGGKPVPHVGWVFVERLPVRGPRSRQSVKEAKSATSKPATAARGTRGSGSPLADQPLPVPSTPPPGPATARSKKAPAAAATSGDQSPAPLAAAATSTPAGATKSVNALMPFLEFVEQHPVGTSCTVVVESYASHGAYARAGDVLVYLPLRLMGNPVPRSARSAVSIGEALAVVIAGYTPERRSIDAALPSAAEGLVATAAVPAAPAPGRSRKRAAAATPVSAVAAEPPAPPGPSAPPAGKPPAARRSRKSVATVEPVVEPAGETPDAPAAPAAAATRRTKKAPAAAVAPAKKAAKRASKRADPAPPARAAAATTRASKRSAQPAAEPAAAPSPAKPVKNAAGRARAAKKAAS
jgi:hypothetical protein